MALGHSKHILENVAELLGSLQQQGIGVRREECIFDSNTVVVHVFSIAGLTARPRLDLKYEESSRNGLPNGGI